MDIKVNHQEISIIEHRVEVETPYDELGKYIPKATGWFRKNVAIKGFRASKAPDTAIIAQVGEKGVRKRAAEILAGDAFDKAMKDVEKKPIAPPRIDIDEVHNGEPIRFTATYYVEPPKPDEMAKEIRDKHYPGILKPEDVFPEGPPGIQSHGPYPLSPDTLRNLPGLNLADKFIPNPLPPIADPGKMVPSLERPGVEIPDPERLLKPLDVRVKLPKDFEELKEEVKTRDEQEPANGEDGEGITQTDSLGHD